MEHTLANLTEQLPPGVPLPNRVELIRFRSREDCRQAIGVLLDWGMLNLTSRVPNEWLVRTDVVRVLRARGVPFDWLTENA